MSQDNNSKLMFLFIGSLFIVTLAMIVVIFVATRRPVVMVVPQGAGGAIVGGGGTAAGPAPATSGTGTQPLPIPELSVIKVAVAPPIDNPLDARWNEITPVEIPVEKQLSAEPTLQELTISKINVQAVRDDNRYVWRISWAQPQACYQSNVSEFSDAVAVQFPMKDGAPYTMGGPGVPVTMLYWKSLWQKDIDQGFQDVTDIYPNSWSDLYWFAAGTGPQPVSTGFENPASQKYMAGWSLGNPMSDEARTKPLEELSAHGYGSSTHMDATPSNARGVWQDGSWHVVFDRPIDASDPLIGRFNQNPDQQLIAFAVWDGNAQNRGGRKHITNWIPMRIGP